ncbi:Ig-like domain-containing protein [Xylanimonas ulmi]|uniref:Uncharacterized protein n=1 Tax=Xylanimonas ulmi TaxID=228973 RepID=A0A4Q7M091_9MICO|nr:SpaA isopeptide-forming pilin-related protein [Xylanibacterium ulmi]RZS60744.1 hypothetical protein EV386_1022 [Xylanibacterium ulmi]
MRVTLGRACSATRLVACAAVALLVGVLVIGVLPAPAGAKPIDDAITGLTVSPMNPLPGQSVELRLQWAVPNDTEAGDTFALALPGALELITTAFELRDGAGNLVATAVVDDGQAVFTLSDYVTTHTNVRGTARFWVRISDDAEKGDEFTFTVGSTTTTIIVGDPGGPGTGGPADLSATKYGHLRGEEGYGGEGDYIDYVVKTPVGPFDTVTFKDTLGEGQAYVCHDTDDADAPSVVYYKIDPDTGDYLATDYPKEDETTIDCAPESATLTVTVKDVPEEFIAVLTYTVQVTEYLDVYENSALITTDRTTDEVPSEVIRMGAGGDGEGDVSDKQATVTVAKTANPTTGTVVGPGQVVTYTLAFDHDGTGEAAVDYTDRLTDVLDDADFVEVIRDGGLSVTRLENGDVRITGSLGADATVSYSVKVKPATQSPTGGDHTLRNVIVKTGEDDGPSTEHPVRYVYVAKVDEHRVALDGAQFALLNDADGTSVDLTQTDTGIFVSGALERGVYRLQEVQAPEGYQLLAEPVRFKVGDQGAVTLTSPSGTGPVTVSLSDDGVYVITVSDRRAYTLPLTGGSGAAAFWLCGGAVLSIVAASLVVGRVRAITQRRQTETASR